MAFDLDQFVADARAAASAARPVPATTELMKRTFAAPELLSRFITPFANDDEVLFEDDSVSVFWVRFTPGVHVPPHNHKMSVHIGVYEGAEINHLYRRAKDGSLERVATKRVGPGDTLSIGAEGIHSVYPEGGAHSLGLHVYLGKLAGIEREVFDPDTGEALPFTDENFNALVRPAP